VKVLKKYSVIKKCADSLRARSQIYLERKMYKDDIEASLLVMTLKSTSSVQLLLGVVSFQMV
jgi:hypothetical protein